MLIQTLGGETEKKNRKYKATDPAGKINSKFLVSFLCFAICSKFLRRLFYYNCCCHYHQVTFIILLSALC